MSSYETPQQREIRELRTKIRNLQNQKSKDADLHRKEIDALIALQEKQNRDMQNVIAQRNADIKTNNQKIKELHEEITRREKITDNKIRDMKNQHDRQIANMNAEFKQSEKQTRNEIAAARQEMARTQQEMRNGFAAVRQETDAKLRNQREHFEQEITNLADNFNSQISEVDGKIRSLADSIAADKQFSRELAEYWIQQAERLDRELTETYRQSLFDRDKQEEMRQKIRNAKDDFGMGQVTAHAAARDAFQLGMKMKEELAIREIEWNYWYNVIRNEEVALLERLQEAESRVYIIENDGETYEYNQGIDYWTNNQLTMVRNNINATRAELSNLDNATIADLKQKEEKVRSLLEELELVENAAHTNVAMSYSRYDIALRIGDILGSDYHMTDSDGDFFSGENREEYHAVYENPMTGDRVVVVITPEPDDAGVVQNHIELIADSGLDNNADNRDEIHRRVVGKIQSQGIQGITGLGSCAGRHGSNTRRVIEAAGDIEAVASGDAGTKVPVPPRQAEQEVNVVRRTQK